MVLVLKKEATANNNEKDWSSKFEQNYYIEIAGYLIQLVPNYNVYIIKWWQMPLYYVEMVKNVSDSCFFWQNKLFIILSDFHKDALKKSPTKSHLYLISKDLAINFNWFNLSASNDSFE